MYEDAASSYAVSHKDPASLYNMCKDAASSYAILYDMALEDAAYLYNMYEDAAYSYDMPHEDPASSYDGPCRTRTRRPLTCTDAASSHAVLCTSRHVVRGSGVL